ncbi:MAG: YggT family protein [Candidatus Accumulibacter sp.]|jgi:YggT family protein|nr:YggT family protein [Accumulibacter sp.]
MHRTFAEVIVLIVDTCVTPLTVLLLARFFMQWSRTPFDNQIGGFVLRLTNWLVLPLRRIVPAIRGFDSASLLAAYLLQILLAALMISLASTYELFTVAMMLMIAANGLRFLLRVSVYLFIVLLVAQAMLSWFNPYAPMNRLVGRLTDPLLRPLRRIVPPISNIDVTPLIAILLAQIVLILV